MPSTPFRLHQTSPPAPDAASDEFDALADLFLADDEPAAGPRRASSAREEPACGPVPQSTAVELLVQGHLPVRAAPWASQYAKLRAAESGAAVALIRSLGGHLSVELFGFGGAAEPALDGLDALRAARKAASACIVQLDEVHQAAVASDPRIAAVTVLAGTNEAAVVASYRALKGLAAVLAPADERAEPPTELQVALVASDEAPARDALERLRRASAVFLDRPLINAGTLHKIMPTGAIPLFRGDSALGPGQVMDALFADEPVLSCEPGAQRGAAQPADACIDAGPLARFIKGLCPSEIAFPDDPEIAIAVCPEKRLHLLRRDHDGRGVERLVSASAWSVKHAALLKAAGLAAEPGRAPVLHLFTETPKSIRPLLDAELKVHLLVSCGGQWCCVELN